MRNLHINDIVAARFIFILFLAEASRISVLDVVRIIEIFRRNRRIIPLAEVALDIDGLIVSDINSVVRAFILPDILHHLHVVIIAENACRGLYVTACIIGSTVDKNDRIRIVARLPLRDPFVPSGYENHLRILCDRIFPLLRKIVAI